MLHHNPRITRAALAFAFALALFPLCMNGNLRAQSDAVPPAAALLPAAPDGAGAEAWYYIAKKAESDMAQAGSGAATPFAFESISFMYDLAFRFGEPTAAKEAGRSLIALKSSQGDSAGVESVTYRWLDSFGPDWGLMTSLVKIYIEAGRYVEALALLARARRELPGTAAAKSAEASYLEYASRAGAGDFSWAAGALSLISHASLDSFGAKALRLAASAPDIDQTARELALFRANFQEKEYGAAAALLDQPGADAALHATTAPRHLLSEAGRAFLYGNALDSGIAFLLRFFPERADTPDAPDSVLATLSEHPGDTRLWIAAYYLARLWQAKTMEREAGILFLGLTEGAPSAQDADAALWYWLDITMRRIASGGYSQLEEREAKRSLQFATLSEASQRWKNPSSFDDIVDEFFRSIMKEKSWNDALTLLLLLDQRLSASIRTRLSYACARLAEEGLADSEIRGMSGTELARSTYSAILSNASLEEYYRTMSAWRLGLEPPLLARMPELNDGAPVAAATLAALPDPANAGGSTLESLAEAASGANGKIGLIENYIRYDLGKNAAETALAYLGSANLELLAALAKELSAEGQHYAALRLARDAVARGAGQTHPELYGLMYPLAWDALMAEAAKIPGIHPALAYGIVRSESVFDPEAVSYAGAVGLSQLMPSTARETARGLKMEQYSLTDPADNLRIGMTYYSYMMNRFDRKPMRAMFAYNAGPGRMTTWREESGELPDDILLETLHLSQPRQYAKNIIQATLAYGKIHYGIEPSRMLDYLVDGKPLESPPAPEMALSQQESQASEAAAVATPEPTAPQPDPMADTPQHVDDADRPIGSGALE